MNAFSFQAMPAPETGWNSNFYIGQASAPVLTVVPKPAGPAIGQVVTDFLAAKAVANRRPSYLKSVKVILRMFIRGREDKPISEFISLDILEEWLARRKFMPATRSGRISVLSSFFSFAKRRGFITENPCSRLERVRLESKPPTILSPEQAETLLRWMSNGRCQQQRRNWRLAQVVLGLFCAIRPAELSRLFWKDVDLERGVVRIDAAVSKVRQRRIVEIPPNAIAWLKNAFDGGGVNRLSSMLQFANGHGDLAQPLIVE